MISYVIYDDTETNTITSVAYEDNVSTITMRWMIAYSISHAPISIIGFLVGCVEGATICNVFHFY